VQVLKALHAHGCAWSTQTCARFAARGELELLQWAVRNGCPRDERITRGAMRYSNVYLLQWAVESGLPMDWKTRKWWRNYDLEKFQSSEPTGGCWGWFTE